MIVVCVNVYLLANKSGHCIKKNYSIKHIFKSKEKLIFDNSKLLEAIKKQCINKNLIQPKSYFRKKLSDCEIKQSLKIYSTIEEVKAKSNINF